MANRKEWEMAFVLSASLNSNFNSAFTKAQQELAKTQSKIQEVYQTQQNVSAYETQGKKIQDLNFKLENLRKQYDLVDEKIKNTSDDTYTLSMKKAQLEQKIRDVENALNKENAAYSETSTKLKEAGIDTNNLVDEKEKLKKKLEELYEEEKRSAEKIKESETSLSNAFTGASDAIERSGIKNKIEEINSAIKECIDVAGTLEYTMSAVEAISGADTVQLAELTAKAKELGATTMYSSDEVAQALTAMSMAGWKASEMLSGMEGIVNLAAAGGEALADATSIVTDGLTAFGLSASDAGHFADVLATAATNSNTDVGKMGETFKLVAPVAGALGYSIEDVAVAVGLMANNGIKASMAGTTLRNMFNKLVPGITLTSYAFGELEYSASNLDGTAKPLSQVISELRNYFSQMSETEKMSNALAIATTRGYAGLLAVLNATEEDYSQLKKVIDDCNGSSARIASIKMDNYKGQVNLMQSAWGAVKTTIGDMVLPTFQKLAATLTTVLKKVNEFTKGHPGLVKGLLATSAALTAVITGITGIAAAIKAFKAIKLFFAGTAIGAAAPAILAIGAAVAGLTGLIVGLTNAQKKEADELDNLSYKSRKEYQNLIALEGEYKKLSEGSAESVIAYKAYEKQKDVYERTKQTVKEYREELDKLLDQSEENRKAYSEEIESLDTEDKTIAQLTEKLNSLYKAGSGLNHSEIVAIVDILNEKISGLNLVFDKQTGYLNTNIKTIGEKLEADKKAAKFAIEEQRYYEAVKENVLLGEKQVELAAELAEKKAELAEVEKAFRESPSPNSVVFGFSSKISKLRTEITTIESELNRVNEAGVANNGIIEGFLQNTLVWSSETADAVVTDSDKIITSTQNLTEEIDKLSEAYKESYEDAYTSVSGQYNLWDTAEKVSATNISSINRNIQGQATYWGKYNENLTKLLEKSKEIEGLDDVIASFADGSKDSVNAIAGMAKASDKNLQKMVSEWQKLETTQKAVSDNIAEISTGYTDEMAKLKEGFEEDIKALDYSEEAKQTGIKTIKSFIEGAIDLLPKVKEAYKSIGESAVNAMNGGAIVNSEEGTAETPKTVAFTPLMPSMGNTSNQTNSVSVAFNIEGNADSGVVASLNSFADDFAQRVMGVINGAGIDQRRLSYV